MEGTGLSLGEAMALTDRRGYDDGFGNGSWFMWIIALAIIFGNGNGFGFGGNNRGYGVAPAVEGIATRDAVNSGFQYNQLDNGIRGVQQGLCDGFYALNNSVKNVGYALDSSIKDCCCTTNRNIDSVKYEMSKGFADTITASNLNTRDILESQNAGVQKILDYLCANEKQALRDRIQTLETSGIIQAQTQNLVSTLRPCPIPAYLTCSPYASYNFGCGTTGGFAYGV
jgi:hypothetical protein